MIKRYRDWVTDDLKEVIEWVEQVEARLHIEASITTSKIRKKGEMVTFTFTAIFEKEMMP